MLNIELNDHTAEDVKQLNELKRAGLFNEEELQKLYDRTQVLRQQEAQRLENERKFNILRGVVMGSFLEAEQKKELIKFINDLEEQEEPKQCD